MDVIVIILRSVCTIFEVGEVQNWKMVTYPNQRRKKLLGRQSIFKFINGWVQSGQKLQHLSEQELEISDHALA